MGAHVEYAKRRLFDDTALNVDNVKFFPGDARRVSPDEVALEITKALAQIESGDYDLIEEFED